MDLSSLPTDTQIEVFSFLNLDSLRRIMITNRSFRILLLSDAAYRLWLFQFELRWGKLPKDIISNDAVLRNDVELPFSGASSESFPVIGSGRLGKTKLPLLLSMEPEKVAEPLFLYFYNPGAVFDVSTRNGDVRLEYFAEFTNHVYTVRASQPLAKPKYYRLEAPKVETQDGIELDGEEDGSSVETDYTYIWRPYVLPYRCQSLPSCVINLSPRLVSYFEISIEARVWEDAPIFRDDDCVCIGLSTSRSRWISRLPGWDKLSYGYHGDNGGLYHGSGRNIGLVGTFGLGDTVGMGVDYINRHIFVTRNGQFVTVAFSNLSEKMLSRTHLLPVVGLHTRHAVKVNYGGLVQPFQFDLARYCNHDQERFRRQLPVPTEHSA